jgi:predicted DNA-binding protein (MmcQ/YjbR family)
MDLDTLRSICLALPNATEEVQWGNHLLFKVAGKMFCITNLDDANDTSFKVSDSDFEELSSGDTYIPAPHMQRARWVKVVQPAAVKLPEWKSRIRESYSLVRAKLTKKAQAELGPFT